MPVQVILCSGGNRILHILLTQLLKQVLMLLIREYQPRRVRRAQVGRAVQTVLCLGRLDQAARADRQGLILRSLALVGYPGLAVRQERIAQSADPVAQVDLQEPTVQSAVQAAQVGLRDPVERTRRLAAHLGPLDPRVRTALCLAHLAPRGRVDRQVQIQPSAVLLDLRVRQERIAQSADPVAQAGLRVRQEQIRP